MASIEGSGSSASSIRGRRPFESASGTSPDLVVFTPFLMAILEGKPSSPPRPISFKPFRFLKSVGLKSVGLGLKDIPYNFGWELVVFEGSTVYPPSEKNSAQVGKSGENLGSKDEVFESPEFVEPCSFGLFPEKETVAETGSESLNFVCKEDLRDDLRGSSEERSLETGGSHGGNISPAEPELATPVFQTGEKRKRVKMVARRSRTPRSRPQTRPQPSKASAPSPPKSAKPTRKSARIAFHSTPRTTKSSTPVIEEISSSSSSEGFSDSDSENTPFKQGTPVFSESTEEQTPPKKTTLPAIKSSPPTAPPKRKTFTPSLSKSATPKTTSSVPPLKRAKKTTTSPSSTKVAHLLKRNIVRGKIVKVPFFEEHGLEVFLQKLRAQQWLDLFANTELGCSGPELAEFYANYAVTEGVVTSTIGDKEVQFDARSLGEILGVPSHGFDVYVREDKSVLGTARLLELSQRLSQNQGLKTPTSVKKGDMTPLHQLLFMFVIRNIIPRGQGRNQADALDQCLVDLLDREEPINLPALMIRHIARIANTTRAHDLGYGFLLTKVFEHFGIELKKKVAAQIIDEIGTDTLMGCGYALAEGSASKQGIRPPRPVPGRSSGKLEDVLQENSRIKEELSAVKAALEEEKALSAKRHEDLLALLSSLASKISSPQSPSPPAP